MKYLPTYEQLYEKMSEEKKEYYRCRWGYNCTTTDTNLEEFYDYYYYGSMRPAAFAEDQQHHMLKAVSDHYNISKELLPIHPHCPPSHTSNPEKVENDIISAFNYTFRKNMAIFNQIGVYEIPELKSLSVLESYNTVLDGVINEIDHAEDGYLMDSEQAVYFLKNCSFHDDLLVLDMESSAEYSDKIQNLRTDIQFQKFLYLR